MAAGARLEEPGGVVVTGMVTALGPSEPRDRVGAARAQPLHRQREA